MPTAPPAARRPCGPPWSARRPIPRASGWPSRSRRTSRSRSWICASRDEETRKQEIENRNEEPTAELHSFAFPLLVFLFPRSPTLRPARGGDAAAVHGQRHAGDPARFVAAEEDRRPADVPGRTFKTDRAQWHRGKARRPRDRK